MTEKEIVDALREHLQGTPGAPPIVTENASGAWVRGEIVTPAPPFWLVSQLKIPPFREGLVNRHRAQGRLIVAVMVTLGEFTGTAETQAELIVSRFSGDLELAAGDGVVNITDRPYWQDGYDDKSYWRVNTHIRWRATL